MPGVQDFGEAVGFCKVSLTFRKIVAFGSSWNAIDCHRWTGVQTDGVIHRQEIMLDLWHNKQYDAKHFRDALPQNACRREETVNYTWRKNTNKMQKYRLFIVNCRCWLLTTVSTYFEHLYAHHQEKRPRFTAYGVYLLVVLDVAGCGTVVLRWGCDHCEIHSICSNSGLFSWRWA